MIFPGLALAESMPGLKDFAKHQKHNKSTVDIRTAGDGATKPFSFCHEHCLEFSMTGPFSDANSF